MTNAEDLRSGKGHRDENFPVASRLIAARHRAPILAFYDFVRTADDIADHADLSPEQKVAMLDRMEADLLAPAGGEPVTARLRTILAERSLSPRHAQDLLKAFRLDATKLRYENWDDLIGYCSYSAMPVGRYVLDVHGEDRSTWPASDAICAALQINNHLQDCGKDYRDLNRVYIPLDALFAAGADVDALGQAKASPELRRCIVALAKRTKALLHEGDALPLLVEDRRLSLEIAVIVAMAERIADMLTLRDPLSEKVHVGKGGAIGIALGAVIKGMLRRLGPRPAVSAQPGE